MKKLITKTLQKNESLFYFWRNYLLFTILFVGCIVPILLKTFWVLEDNVEKDTYRNVAEGMSVLDNEIMILNNVVIDMRSSRHFSSVRSMDEVRKGSDYAILNDMQEKLKDSTQFLSFAIEPMLYFSNGVMFFNDMTFAIEAQYLYKRFYEESHADLKNWMEELAAQEYTYALLPSESYFSSIYGEFDGIAYVHSYKLASHQESSVFVTVFPVDSLVELLGLQELQDIAGITISNKCTGQVLYSNDIYPEGRANRIEVLSSSSNLMVEVSIPQQFFFGQLEDLILLCAAYLVIFIVIAVIVSVILAYKNTMPIQSIVSLLNKYMKDPQEKGASYDYIEKSITEIGDSAIQYENQHKKLSQEIAHWLLREHILNGLDEKQAEELLRVHENFPMPFRLLIIQLTYTEWNILSGEVKELLLQNRISFSFFSKVKPNLFVMMDSSVQDYEALKESLSRFREEANAKWECDCIVSIGKEHDSLVDLNEIYHLVHCNMKYFSERKLIFQEDVEADEDNKLRELNLLENVNLTDMILSGNEKEAVRVIRSQWNKIRNYHSESMLEQLFFMQAGILNSTAAQLNCDKRLMTLQYNDNIAGIESKIVSFVEELCSLVLEKKETDKNDVPKQIVEYMKENFSNPDFYMTSLVEEFGLSQKTIARTLKAYLNKTFSEYLEELRLRKARELLGDTRLNVVDVAKESGFGSVDTFFKAFKRKYGVSPSNYRAGKQMMNSSEE